MSLSLLIAAPFALTLVLWLIRHIRQVAAPLAGVAYLALAALLHWADPEPFVVLNRGFALDPAHAGYMSFVAASLALLMFVGSIHEESSLVWPGSMAAFGFMLASACATSIEIASVALALSVLGISFCLIAPHTAETNMRTVITLLAGALLLLLAGWAVESPQVEDPAPIAILGRTTTLYGLWLLLGVFPFSLWIPPLGRTDRPTSAFLATCALSLTVCLRLPELSVLVDARMLMLALLWGGAATILYGAIGALLSRQLSAIVSYAAVADMGIALLALSSDPSDASGMATAHMAYRALACATLWGASRLLGHCFGSDDIRVLGGAMRRAPITLTSIILAGLSLAGIAPMAGFASRVMISAATGWSTFWVVIWAVGTAGSAWGIGRVVVASWGASPPPGSRREPRGIAVLLLVGALTLLALGLFPGLAALIVPSL